MSSERRNRRFTKKAPKNNEKTGEKPARHRRSTGVRAHNVVGKPKKPSDSKNKGSNKRGGKGREGGAGWIWGFHAANAALSNPKRTIHDIYVTENARERLSIPGKPPFPKLALPSEIDRLLPRGASHQGVALRCAPLEWPDISDIAFEAPDDGLIIVLDQITDPHNVGAMLRLASAFGANALVIQDRHAPPLAGALAKVATGCLETVPVCQVTNIGNTLQDLAKTGWFITGLAGETDLDLADAVRGESKKVIVMGAEGAGLRPRVRDCCDQLARIPMHSYLHGEKALPGQAESLNVATAAAIALYEVRRKEK